MAPQVPKMSLVAQYDDLCRYTNILTKGCEEEFKIFVESQHACMRKWKEAEKEIQTLRDTIFELESDKKRLETQNMHIKSLCETEINKRKKIEMEKSSMERQIDLIKKVLLADGNTMDNQTKEMLLSATCKLQNPGLETIEESVGSLLSLSDYDGTDDDLDNTNRRKRRSKGKRRSAENRGSSKRKKSTENTIGGLQEDDFPLENKKISKETAEKFRSNSDPTTKTPDMQIRPTYKCDSEDIRNHAYELRRSNTGNLSGSTPVGRYSTGGKLSRTHAFCSKTVIRAEKCHPCGRIIKFCKQALKCQDCRVTCHPECKDQCPLPCIPTVNTPTKGNMGTIADYTSSTAPMIPSLIVHCVNEIESRGFKEIGLYRISGSEREVKELKKNFLSGKSIPNINQADIHAVCGTVKEFLRSLSEPLIPRSTWQTFVEAAEIKDDTISLNALYNAVCDLPQPNKDTLAFLVLHLQRVAESPECKMPLENIAKIFGPTIVGYSTAEPAADCNMLTETTYQVKVMHRLLIIPADSWRNLLNVDQDVFTPTPKSPEPIPAPSIVVRGGRLGPIYYPSSQNSRNVQVGRTPLTPRNTRHGSSSKSGKRQFFSSPLLK
ncbi:rac GTPase-activating protein 1-like isoform X2 [Stegodyphus dumicola]|uniref:rac GTPase-activating protein 1-like isoform X2 n=1 Tax=Stegodyphus dumicola TaxID=202533 RepID=UPI0015A9467E|nr:rac GTPase-activating protein 1-like isoform X2 [Stegodyphus dumicola]